MAVLDFNHISKDLSDSEVQTLTDYYSHYHKLEYLYRKTYKFYRNVNIALNIATGLLTSTTIVTLLSPINPLSALVGSGVLIITGISEGVSIRQKITKAQFIYQQYQTLLNDLKSYLRGAEYDREDLVHRLNLTDNVITDIGLPFVRRFEKRYKKKDKWIN